MKSPAFVPGDRVMFARSFLRSTGQLTGPEAPCAFGPFAAGEVREVKVLSRDMPPLVLVHWDDGSERKVLASNLVHANRRHLEPV